MSPLGIIIIMLFIVTFLKFIQIPPKILSIRIKLLAVIDKDLKAPSERRKSTLKLTNPKRNSLYCIVDWQLLYKLKY